MTAFSQPERRGLQRQQLAKPESHPDADLLTAFAEHSLTARERDQVLGHLAACASCREVVSLAGSPLIEPVPEPARKRGIWEMPLFHWGAVAATAIVVVAAVSLGLYERNAPRPTTAAVLNETLPPAQVAEQNEITAEPGTEKTLEKQKSPVPAQIADENAPASSKRAIHLQQQVRYEAATDATTAKKDKDAASAAAGIVAGQVAAPPPPPTANAMRRDYGFNTRSNAELARNAADLKQAPAAAPAKAAAATAKSAPAATQTQASEMVTVDAQSGAVPLSENQPIAEQKVTSAGTLRNVEPPTANKNSSTAEISGRAAKWQITRKGRLQQLAGGSWQNVMADRSFRSVASVGTHVWAGGDNGALYTSPDNGATWTPITVRNGNVSLSGSITRLRFTDVQNGAIQTSTGETWITNDGGATWNKQ